MLGTRDMKGASAPRPHEEKSRAGPSRRSTVEGAATPPPPPRNWEGRRSPSEPPEDPFTSKLALERVDHLVRALRVARALLGRLPASGNPESLDRAVRPGSVRAAACVRKHVVGAVLGVARRGSGELIGNVPPVRSGMLLI